MNNITKYFAEFFGTFVLVFIGCGSAVIAYSYIGFLGIAFAFGLKGQLGANLLKDSALSL